MTTPNVPPVPPAAAAAPVRSRYEVPIDLLATLRQLYRAKSLLFGTTLAGVLVGLGLALRAKPFYTAAAVFLPPRTTDVLGSGSGGGSLFGSTDNSDIYLGLLQSRTLQDDVIEHLNLMEVYHTKLHVDAELALAGHSSFVVTKNSLITVATTADDPKLAAAMANTYLEALYRLNATMLESGSKHRSDFLREQVTDERKALLQAEDELKAVQERTGINLPTGEAQVALSNTAQLTSEIDTARARLAGLLTSGTEDNPEVKAARNELNQLQAALSRQQSAGTGSGIASTRSIPALTLELQEKQREVTLRDSVYQTLVQQYEHSRLAAIDPGSQLQIVDIAEVPERKAGPARKQYLVYGFSVGLIAGLLFLFGYAPLRRFIRILRQPDTLGPI